MLQHEVFGGHGTLLDLLLLLLLPLLLLTVAGSYLLPCLLRQPTACVSPGIAHQLQQRRKYSNLCHRPDAICNSDS